MEKRQRDEIPQNKDKATKDMTKHWEYIKCQILQPHKSHNRMDITQKGKSGPWKDLKQIFLKTKISSGSVGLEQNFR